MISPKCYYCSLELHLDNNTWVDKTLGDCCSGDDYGINENKQHFVI